MIIFEKTKVYGFEDAVRGARNPLNSWERSDSYSTYIENPETLNTAEFNYILGEKDLNLLGSLAKAGRDHAKYRRMINVWVDITAPLYWWKEFDTYKVGTVANSCSTMHTITWKEFTVSDFSCEHLFGRDDISADADTYDDTALAAVTVDGELAYYTPQGFLTMICNVLNHFRTLYLMTKDKNYWWQIIQLLPSSYNQKRTIMLNYEVLANIYSARRFHKLDEWISFCKWIEDLPYASDIIFGGEMRINAKSDTETDKEETKG